MIWQTKKLGEISEYIGRGISPKYILNGGIFVLNQKCVRAHRISYDEARKHDTSVKKVTSEKLIQLGDVLVNSTGVGTLGRVAQVKNVITDTTVDSHITIVRPIKGIFDNNFFGYVMIYVEDFLKELGEGASGQIELSRAKLKDDFIITFPKDLNEQKRIVKKLDEVLENIEKAKENTEKNLQNSRNLFESYLQSIFSKPRKNWEEKRIGEILQKTETINPRNNPNKEFTYVDVSSVNKDNFTIESTSLIMGKNAPSRARKFIKTGDVIFATVRPTLKRIAVIPQKLNEQVCSTGYFVLRTMEQLNNKFVFYFLQTQAFNEEMKKLQKGASYPAVTDGEVRSQVISYPKSLTEQKSIVVKLDTLFTKTKELKIIYKQKLVDLEELKKSILHEAFSGKL